MTRFINDLTGGNQFYSGAVDIDPRTLQYFIEEATGGTGRTAFRFYEAGKQLTTDFTQPSTDILGVRRVLAGPRDYVDSEIYERNVQEVLKFQGAMREFAETDIDEEKMSETEEEFLERIGSGLEDLTLTGSKIVREKIRDAGYVSVYDATTKFIKEKNKELRQLNLDYQAAEDYDTKMELEAEKKQIQLDILVKKKNFNQEFNEIKKMMEKELKAKKAEEDEED